MFFLLQFTYADIAVASAFELVDFQTEKAYQGVSGVEDRFTFLDKYPLLKKHREMVYALDGIKQWVAKRPVTPL